jgi:hypothetical protein
MAREEALCTVEGTRVAGAIEPRSGIGWVPARAGSAAEARSFALSSTRHGASAFAGSWAAAYKGCAANSAAVNKARFIFISSRKNHCSEDGDIGQNLNSRQLFVPFGKLADAVECDRIVRPRNPTCPR